MTLIINSILVGTWGMTAALLIVQLFRLTIKVRPLIINAIGFLLIFGSTIYLLKITADTKYLSFRNMYSANFLIIFFTWPAVFGLLPQLLWFRQLRERLISLVAIIAIWTLTFFFVPWGLPQILFSFAPLPTNGHAHNQFTFGSYLEVVAIYAVLFAMVYSIVTSVNISNRLQLTGGKTRGKKYAGSF